MSGEKTMFRITAGERVAEGTARDFLRWLACGIPAGVRVEAVRPSGRVLPVEWMERIARDGSRELIVPSVSLTPDEWSTWYEDGLYLAVKAGPSTAVGARRVRTTDGYAVVSAAGAVALHWHRGQVEGMVHTVTRSGRGCVASVHAGGCETRPAPWEVAEVAGHDRTWEFLERAHAETFGAS
jgi:hypothetical protein